MRSEMSKLEAAAHFFSIVAGLATVITLFFGFVQFREGQELQREAQAVDVFLKYNDLKVTEVNTPREAFWKKNAAIAMAESIYRLVGSNDDGWKATVRWMVTSKLHKYPRGSSGKSIEDRVAATL